MTFSNTLRDKTDLGNGIILEKGVWSAGGDVEGVITADTTDRPYISEAISFGVNGGIAAPAPKMVYEETVTAADDVAQLAFVPAHIMYVSNDTKAFAIVDVGTTPGAGEVAVDFVTGQLTFAAADSDPVVKVTYWPAASNLELASNLVVSDTVDAVPAAGHASRALEVITITGGATAILSVDVDGVPFKPLIDDDTPGTGEFKVLWDSTGDTVLTGTGAEFSGATSIKITFIKAIAGFNFVEDASAHSSDVVTIVNAFYILRASCFLYTDDNDVPHTIRNSSATLAANQVSFNPRAVAGAKFTYEAATDVAASGVPYVAMLPAEIASANSVATGTLKNAKQNQIGVACDPSDSGTYWILGRAS